MYHLPLLRSLVNKHKSINILMKDGFSALLRLPSFSAGVKSLLLLFSLSQIEPLQQFHSKQGNHLFSETQHTLRMLMRTSAGDLECYTTPQYTGNSFCILFILSFNYKYFIDFFFFFWSKSIHAERCAVCSSWFFFHIKVLIKPFKYF